MGRFWDTMNAQSRTAAADLTCKADIPADPGVYAWYEDDRPVYVGKGDELRERIWPCHMGRGARMRNSAFRRNVAEDLGIASAKAIYDGDYRLSAAETARVNERVRKCSVAWIPCETISEARDLERRMKAEWLPPLTKR